MQPKCRRTGEQRILPPALKASSVALEHYPWPILAAFGRLLHRFDCRGGFIRIHRRERERRGSNRDKKNRWQRADWDRQSLILGSYDARQLSLKTQRMLIDDGEGGKVGALWLGDQQPSPTKVRSPFPRRLTGPECGVRCR